LIIYKKGDITMSKEKKFRQVICFVFAIMALSFITVKAIGEGKWETILKTQPPKDWVLPCVWKINFVDEKVGWASGLKGQIWHTQDGGLKWEMQESGVDEHLSSIYFVDNMNGWCVSREGSILATLDGGKTWQKQQSGTNNRLNGVFFFNVTIGWVVGDHGTILYTEDGGITWIAQESGVPSRNEDVHFVSEREGWVVGRLQIYIDLMFQRDLNNKNISEELRNQFENKGIILSDDVGVSVEVRDVRWLITDNKRKEKYTVGKYDNELRVYGKSIILHTDDGGITWQKQENEAEYYLEGVHFVNSFEGWAVGDRILHTNDGGKTWEIQVNRPPDRWFYDVSFVNTKEGWVVGGKPGVKKKGQPDDQPIPNDGIVLHTIDGGKAWEEKVLGENVLPYGVNFISSARGWIAATESIFDTSDGGITWTKRRLRMPGKVDDPGVWQGAYFLNENKGWVVGSKIIVTSDGGKSWEIQEEYLDDLLRNVYFFDENNGWVTTSGGRLSLHTKDGGKTWEDKDFGGSSDFHFLSEKRGFMLGGKGLCETDDGGETWKQVLALIARTKIDFINERVGFIVNDAQPMGRTLYTDDGGHNWKRQGWWPPDVLLRDIDFASENHGWAIGDSHMVLPATILHTNDGARTWEKQYKLSTHRLNSICFVNEKEGWVVGGFHNEPRSPAIILHTKDGGKHWETQYENKDFALYSICYDGKNSLYAAGGSLKGSEGIILKYTDPFLRSHSVEAHQELTTTWGKVKTALYQNYPNPFNPETWIPFSLGEESPVRIFIYNQKGQIVRKLDIGKKEAGEYLSKEKAVYWNAKDEKGQRVASGVYYYTIEAKEYSATRKMAIIK
jgi:photosystem II stability/assembly factor-like uncharacterized protein